MKISIVGIQGIPARYGGFETLAQNLVENLYEKYEFKVACSKYAYRSKDCYSRFPNIEIRYISLKANGLQSILYDMFSILILAPKSDVFLILGTSAGIFIPFFKFLFSRKKFYMNPDGMEWQREKWSKPIKKYLKLSLKVASKSVDKIIIDNSMLIDLIDKKYHSKVVEIGYGGDQYGEIAPKDRPKNKRFWLTIARSVPENNLDLIANAFSEMRNENWVLISNFKDSLYGRQFIRRFGHLRNIKLIPSIYNKQVIAKYLNNCTGYIHGHTAGGTNPSLVSAMFYCNPILCHDNIFNRKTSLNKAAYFKDKSDLTELLKKYKIVEKGELYTNEQLEVYTWNYICNKYDLLFENAHNNEF